MVLSSDAAPCTCVTNPVFQENINKDILPKIEDDLDIDEKISILFLMLDDYTHGFKEVSDLLQKYEEERFYILVNFVDHHSRNWESKLLEALCVIQNRQIIRKLGLSFHDLELLYFPKNKLCSRYLNPIAKCLYLLCEELTENDKNLLLQRVKSDLSDYDKNVKNTDYLELHMLYWIQQRYISIQKGDKVNLKNLLKHLKSFDNLELIYEDLKKHEDHQNVLDIQTASSSMSHLQVFSGTEEVEATENVQELNIQRLKKGLCIIISQMFFSGQKFETRFGTLADRTKLAETFQGFGFTVKILNNLKKDEMLQMLENIPKDFGTDYDCIFICILSHGCKGGIISSDEQEVSIEAIEHQICCEQLKDVIKIVIIQACQGEVKGQINDVLTTDGPSNYNVSNILAYRNFCIFMSTMQGFVSVRHKAEGSWFIQEFCNILQHGGKKITFLHATTKIIQSVTQKKGKVNGINSVAQLPELRSCRLLTDFWLPEYQHNS